MTYHFKHFPLSLTCCKFIWKYPNLSPVFNWDIYLSLTVRQRCLYSGYDLLSNIFLLEYILSGIFFPVCGLIFHFPNGIFQREIWHTHKLQLSIFLSVVCIFFNAILKIISCTSSWEQPTLFLACVYFSTCNWEYSSFNVSRSWCSFGYTDLFIHFLRDCLGPCIEKPTDHYMQVYFRTLFWSTDLSVFTYATTALSGLKEH